MSIGVFGYEFYLNKKEKDSKVEKGLSIKENTNDYFLPSSTTGEIVHHEYYSLSYNELHEQAEWVAYELKKDQIKDSNFKRPYFELDPAVKTGSAHWRNYKNSGFDRGHLCPAGDRQFSELAYKQTFLTSNISPQNHGFNSGIWNRLEQQVRSWALKYDGVFVVTGGVLKNDLTSIGNEEVSVPKYFYKIILDYNRGNPKLIGYLLPHRDSHRPLEDFEVTVDSLESLTGINFFYQFDDSVEEKLESTLSYDKW